MTYEQHLTKVLEKCQLALEQGKRFIEIRPYGKPSSGYRLYAWSQYHGRCVAYGFQYHTLEAWANAIMDVLIYAGWCAEKEAADA